jgi:hypothetical protein
MRYEHPRELADHLFFLSTIDAHFSDEYGTTTQSAFDEARQSLEYFVERARTDETKELLRQCLRNLDAALDHLEKGEDGAGSRLLLETEELFKRLGGDLELG